MLEVHVNINRKQTLATLHAVRIKPKTKIVKDGTICKYNIVYENEIVGNMEGAFGCGIDLAIQLLEHWKKDGDMYKTMVFYKKLKGMEKDK